MHSHPGYIPTRRKAGDPLLYSTSAVPTDTHTVDLSMFPALYQAQEPACVAHAITQYVMWLHYKKTGEIKLLSPRFLYALTIKAMGTDPTQGSSLAVALKTAQTYGICEDVFLHNDTSIPVNDYVDLTKITQDAYNNGLNYRINKYHFLATLDEMSLKQAMNMYGLLLYGINISDSWWKNSAGFNSWLAKDLFPIRPPKGMTDPSLSHHLILGYGYDQTPFDYFRNSFGSTWGQNGNGWFGTNDVGYIYEAAVIEDLQDAPTPAPVIQKANDIVNTIQQVQTVENQTVDPVVKANLATVIAQLWQSFLVLFK